MEEKEVVLDEGNQTANGKSEETPKKLKPKEEILKLKNDVLQLKEELLKNQAELVNYKKRINQERINDRKYASRDLIGDFLQPLEQMSKIVSMETDNDLLKNFLLGFKMISDQLYQVLENDGLEKIESLDKKFDPNYHYAVEKENDKTKENGTNLEVIQEGYMYKEKILRPAMVKVNEWSEENGEDK